MNSNDIYHQWLGIPPSEQPPSLYRLLGLVDFEHDPEVIRNAAERQAMHVRRLGRGEFTDAGQELLNEIAAAKLSLINPTKRQAYDQSLRQRVEPADGHGRIAAQGVDRGTIAPGLPPLRLARPEASYLEMALRADGDGRYPAWIIGYHPDCDIRIKDDTISGIHCQVLHDEGQLFLSDLKSTNGTFVNQERITATRRVHSTDLITLGRRHRIILPAGLMSASDDGATRAIFVGRGPGNEWQLDDTGVSFYHARLLLKPGGVTVDDLNSRQGIRLDRPGQDPLPIKTASLRPDDILWLAGSRIDVRRIFDQLERG